MKSPKNDQVAPGGASAGGAGVPTGDESVRYFEGLIGQIEIALPQRSSRVLLLSSSISGEGTTEVAAGLGLTLATAMGRKTALIDCNVHHPDMHLRFGVADIGLGQYLAGEVPIDKALANTVVPNMYIMPVGKGLGSLVGVSKQEVEKLIRDLRSRFEYVLIDAAPVGTYPDCAVLCDQVDGVVLVIKHGSTRREVVQRTREVVTRAGGTLLGVVLNRRRFPIPDFVYRRL